MFILFSWNTPRASFFSKKRPPMRLPTGEVCSLGKKSIYMTYRIHLLFLIFDCYFSPQNKLRKCCCPLPVIIGVTESFAIGRCSSISRSLSSNVRCMMLRALARIDFSSSSALTGMYPPVLRICGSFCRNLHRMKVTRIEPFLDS